MLCLLYVTIKNLYYILGLRNVLGNVVTDNLCLVVLIKNFLLHHALTNSSHLWTMLWVYDSSNDVTTESRTNLIELLLIVLVYEFTSLILHLHVKVTNLKLGTIGSKTAEESRAYTRTEVTTDNGSTHETNLWLLFLEEVNYESCVRI